MTANTIKQKILSKKNDILKVEVKVKEGGNTTKTKKAYKRRYFLPHARLNIGQRKYCHCLMKARLTTKNAYSACQVMRARVARSAKTRKAKRQLIFNPVYTNCIMGYDFTDYSLEEVQALAKEKKIQTHYNILKSTNKKIKHKSNMHKHKSNNIYKPYSKDKLVEKLAQHYVNTKKLNK